MARKSRKIQPKKEGEKFNKITEHEVPEEIEDDTEQVEPAIIGKGEQNGEETSVVHEPTVASTGDKPINLGLQEADEKAESEGHGGSSEENNDPQILTPDVLSELDDLQIEGMELNDRPVDIVHEKSVLEKNTGPNHNDRERIKKLNECADYMLTCLAKGIKQEFELAAKDYECKDIGIYVLGVLNRLYKAVDLYNPDFEPEWEYGKVGQDTDLFCDYCHKKILEPKNPRQLYCNNMCARFASERDKTGIVQPNERYDGTEAEMDALDWEREQKSLGASS